MLQPQTYDVVNATRDAAFAMFLVQGGLRPWHYVRFPGRHSDVAVKWPPAQPLGELQSFGLLTGLRASALLNAPLNETYAWQEIRESDSVKFVGATFNLFRARSAFWNVADQSLEVFTERCGQIADAGAMEQLNNDAILEVIDDISAFFLEEEILHGADVAHGISERLGGMWSPLFTGFANSIHAESFAELLIEGP